MWCGLVAICRAEERMLFIFLALFFFGMLCRWVYSVTWGDSIGGRRAERWRRWLIGAVRGRVKQKEKVTRCSTGEKIGIPYPQREMMSGSSCTPRRRRGYFYAKGNVMLRTWIPRGWSVQCLCWWSRLFAMDVLLGAIYL